MATFKIHEDLNNYLPTNKFESFVKNKILQEKHTQNGLKECGFKNRKPFGSNETNLLQSQINITQKSCMEIEPSKVSKEILQQKRNSNKENSQPIIDNLAIIQSQTFKQVEDKENSEFIQDISQQYYFSIDNLFLTTVEYHDNIYHHLLNLERTLNRPKYDYMSKQPELTHKMRSILVDWLSAVAEEYNMQPQTIHLTVQYIDYFLSRMSVVKTKFQLVGAAAMMIAAKYEEIYPPNSKEWAYLTADAFSFKQVLKMEQLILKVLQFDVARPTAYSFISHLCTVCNLTKPVMLLAMYLSELVLLEGQDYIKYLPSQVAFSSIALARHTIHGGHPWPQILETRTGCPFEDLSPLIMKQHKSFKDSPTRPQQAIQDKFKSPKYGKVSLFKPKELDYSLLDESL